MNILMMTNTYKPILGGLEKSIEIFTNELRAAGHDVVIVAPEFQGMETEEGVIRIPAIQNFNGSDFSVQLPIPGILEEALGTFSSRRGPYASSVFNRGTRRCGSHHVLIFHWFLPITRFMNKMYITSPVTKKHCSVLSSNSRQALPIWLTM